MTRYELKPRHNPQAALAPLLGGLTEQAVQRVSRVARLRRSAERAARVVSWQLSTDDVTTLLDPSSTAEATTLTESLLRATEAAVDQRRQGYALLHLLLASAHCDYPPLEVSDLRQHTSKDDPYVNVLMGRLTEAGVVYRVAKGQYSYTVPQFYEYLRRRRDPRM